MHPALIKLLKLRFRAARRRMLRGARTPRGVLLLGLGVAMLVLWLGPSLFMAIAAHQRSDPEIVRTIVPLALLGLCLMNVLTSSHEKSVHFLPAEVDFLFSGPFSRRELLAYKLAAGFAGALFLALFFSIVFLRHATLWIAALVGFFLTALFVQLLSTALALIGQTLAKHAYTRVRRCALLLVIGLLVLGGWSAFSLGAEQGFLQLAKGFRGTTLWFCLLAPFEVFGRTITAERLIPDLAGWATLALAVDAALLALVMWLDVNYLEAAAAISQKLYRRMQQARRTGVGWTATQGSARWHLPSLPRMGGAGPIAWRQLTTAMRSARGLLILMLIMGAATAPMFATLGESRDPGPGGALLGPLAGTLVFLTIFLVRLVPFDFRGDLDHMDWLKSLPLKSTAIAAGQLLTPVLIMTTIHLVILGAVAACVPQSRLVALGTAMFILPFNFLLFGIENLAFLLFPARMVAATPGDFQFVGRMMLEIFAKMIVLAACCGLAALLGAVAYLVSGGSWIVTLTTAWFGLATPAGMIVPCLAWAYRRFDVSVDTPP